MPLGAPQRIPVRWSCYSILDRGDVPQPTEDASETAWREFDACWEALDRRVRQARGSLAPEFPPCSVQRSAAAQAQPRPGPAMHVDAVMQLARMNDRVCPSPPAWMRLHQLLRVLVPGRRTDPLAPPLDAAAWNAATDLQKRLHLREQLAWAQRHGGLHVAHEYLRALHEDDWHHHTPPDWPALQGTRS